MRTTLITLATFIAALALTTGASADATSSRSTLTARASSYGTILFDGRGFALYAFTLDTARRSNCSGPCAKAWPPYIVSSRATAAIGVTKSRLGTIERSDGRLQVTYAGKPLYYYVGDRKPRQVLCQNVEEFGGRWRVVGPNGRVVR
jgi:predicted lipoprotein with Yx(FWY)xxD motif